MDRMVGEVLMKFTRRASTDPGAARPDVGVPVLLDRTYALDEKVKIDLQLTRLSAKSGAYSRGDHVAAGRP